MADSVASTNKKEMEEYKIHESCVGWLDKKFAKMTKVANEIGVKPPTYKVLREEMVERKELDKITNEWKLSGKFDKYFVVTVEGEAPKIAGWKFAATLTPTPTGNIISRVPGIEGDIPEHFRKDEARCDYCGTKRNRTDSFLVRNESGEYKQIGRNCLAKFLGYSNPERVARYAEFLINLEKEIADEEEEMRDSGRVHDDYFPLEDFLATTVAVVERDGWRSVTAAREGRGAPTLSEVLYNLSPLHEKNHPKIEVTESHRSKARELIAFARSDKLNTDNDYKHNLKISTASAVFHTKAAGIVASLVDYHERNREYEIERQRKQKEYEENKVKQKASIFVGTIGERIKIHAQVVFARTLDSGQFGPSYLYKMVDDSGNSFTWFSSSNVMGEDRWYQVIGTVKKHEEYQGVKQTVLTRCKVEEDEPVVLDMIGDVLEPIGKREEVHNKQSVRSVPEMRPGTDSGLQSIR